MGFAFLIIINYKVFVPVRKRPLYAVITGDLVKSSRTPPGDRDRVLRQLRSVFDSVDEDTRRLEGFQIFRGDSFQTVLDEPADALKAALLLRGRCLIEVGLDVRLAVGVGPIEYRSRKSVGEGIGPAFTFSGRALDGMSEPRRFAITTPDEGINLEMAAFAAMIDAIVRSWSKRAILVVVDSIAGKTQQAIAAALKISQPAVSQRLAIARWWAVEEAMKRWKAISSQLVTKPNRS
jgi:hypothetical protein